ncbi:MAG: hypothetical protein LBR74_02625 [Eubacterium sp.]|jgi:DNA-directed RNA polymerase subunit M/transcription elongation factor TFIIS|nr:hypothetical protein [Eubacterium sp.]
MPTDSQTGEFRSSLEECYAIANQILDIQEEINTKTMLWKAMGWTYFLKPVPGTTAEDIATEKAAKKKVLITWLGVPVGALVLGLLFILVELSFTKALGGILVIAASLGLYADIIILPVKISTLGVLGRMGEQMGTIYKGPWKAAKAKADALVQSLYNEAKLYVNEYNGIVTIDKLLKELTASIGILGAMQQSGQTPGKAAAVNGIKRIMAQYSLKSSDGDALSVSEKLKCPKCGSDNLQFEQKSVTTGGGMNTQNACCGYILLGPLGALCGGAMNRQPKQTNTTYWVCSNCGHKF